ncbi:MAG: hypothetical protein HZB39_12895 [Planctomycetes bacterium]|nr:hypothetical protein [Planctomycetota bacterium]
MPRSPFDPPFKTPATVQEGGSFVIEAGKGTEKVEVSVPGHGMRVVRIVDGRGEFQVPPGVRGGTPIFVDDGRVPNPHTTTVWVVGGQSP